ncbi:F-box only protein 15 [Bufo gargarizans]|uniref:F-box only protein 15 n=1 Tax=Bufo gargarizans TaxID=30331 RepID=UPI001CF5DAD7|nr:F-box only protein 15 [Bufo gargarizans]
MASGRGWIHQQHNKSEQRPRPAAQTLPPRTPTLREQHRCATISKAAPIKKSPLVRKPTKSIQQRTRTCLSQAAYIESLPCEILLKILSYLDPISLMVVSSVNKRLYELSKDNVIWYKMYISHWKVKQRWQCHSMYPLEKKLSDTTISDPDPGYWKKTYVREIATAREKKMTQIMKTVKLNRSNDLSVNMQKAVKMSGLTWALRFLDVHGKETVIEHTDVHFRDSSLTVTWNSYLWPEFCSLIKVQLHGITPLLTDKCPKPIKNGLQRLSLIAEYDLRNKKDFGRFVGQDMHIKLFHIHPWLIVGLWRKSPEIAFVMGTLHYHQLLEKSFWGSADSLYTFPPHVPLLDDIDPQYGLHGYQLHIDMYSGPRTYLCRTFRGLFCRREFIKHGYLRMAAIGLWNNRMHSPLAGKVDFLWETFTLNGRVQNCFLMDVTVSHEAETPYWCFSAPVALCANKTSETLYDFMGQSFELNYKDDMGKVHAELMWMKETDEHYVVNLVLYLKTEKVNSYFGTNYTDCLLD